MTAFIFSQAKWGENMENEGLLTVLEEIAKNLQTNQWSAPNIVTIVIAAAAALASIVLCIVTICSHRRDTKSLRGDIFSNIINNHRNLFNTIYSNDKLYTTYKKNVSASHNEEAVLGTFFINHADYLYYYYNKSLIDDDIWNSLEIDIVEIFNMPFVKKRWEDYQEFYPTNFYNYIKELEKAYKFFLDHKDMQNQHEVEILANELTPEAKRIFLNFYDYYCKQMAKAQKEDSVQECSSEQD